MNPSAAGWLKKCMHRFKRADLRFIELYQFYIAMRSTGFVYGSSQKSIIPVGENLSYTQEELAKINLLVALLYVDFHTYGEQPDQEVITRLVHFYDSLNTNKEHTSFLKFKTNDESKLEQLLHKRVQTNEGLFQKNFSHLITNALLFTDVLTYEKMISSAIDPLAYEKRVERILMSTVYDALNQKTAKGKYDLLILKLLKGSLRYNAFNSEKYKIDGSVGDYELKKLGRFYIFDLACMAVYSDEEIELSEISFMNDLGSRLQLEKAHIHDSIEFLFQFVTEYKNTIAYFNFSNPLNHFYKRNQRAVKLLLTRNKKRLYKEITQSKELVYLISQSTHRELNTEEKAKAKKQLYDIFKSIPSLAIFVLPGGSVLLPIIIKFIPQLLPSAFNENLENDE